MQNPTIINRDTSIMGLMGPKNLLKELGSIIASIHVIAKIKKELSRYIFICFDSLIDKVLNRSVCNLNINFFLFTSNYHNFSK